MSWIILVIAAIILLCIKNSIFNKIDEDEKKALSTPGRADFLRKNYQEVITFIENKPNYQILFERADMIKMGLKDGTEYYAISNFSGGVLIAFVRYSSVVKEWHFKREEMSKHIIYEIGKVS